MSHTYARVRRHPWLLLPVVAVGLMALFLVASAIFAADQTQNATVELDGNIANDTASGTDWGPNGGGNGICTATGVLGSDGNGYIAPNSLPANIGVSTCDGDSYLTSTSVADIGSGKAFGKDLTYFSSNKDIQDIQAPIAGVSGVWGCTQINNPTPKDEILNSYAALGTLAGGNHAGDTSLFVGFERGKNTGTSFQGVWFLQKPVGCTAPATGSANFTCDTDPAGGNCHTPWVFDMTTTPWTVESTGDVLLLINFSGGGNDTSANMYLWAPAAVTALGRSQDAYPLMLVDGNSGMPFGNATGSDCQDQTSVGAFTAVCATTNNPVWNTLTTPAPNTPTDACIVTTWPPANQASCVTGATGKTTNTGGSPILDKLQFFEGMVNLTNIFGSVPCFSQALFEARSSDVPNATLKDYTLGDFDTCGTIIIHKETDPEDVNQAFTYTTSSNPSAGSPLQDFSLTDDGNNELGCDYNGSTGVTTDDCGTNGTLVVENVPPGTYTVSEDDPTALTPPFDFKSLTCQVNSGSASKSINGRTATITIGTLGVVECLYENRQRGSIFFEKVDEGNSLLGGATFTISPNPYGTGTLDVTDNDSNDSNSADGKFCLANVPFNSKYTITEKTAPPGYEKDPTSQDVSVQTTDDCAAKETAGGFPVFTNKLGTIVIKKTDEGDNPLGGACFTLTPNPKTGTGTLRVCDNPVSASAPADQQTDGANDTDTTVGTICITGARLNASGEDYDIVESITPAGYEPDSTTHHVTVSDSKGCSTTTATTTFVNKLGTIVIKKTDEGANPLGGACFTLTPNPKTGTGTLRVCDNPVSASAPADQQTDGANDTDTTVGTICITGARLNASGEDYDIVESITPAGYEPDSTTHHVTVSDSKGCSTTTATTTFVNKLGSLLIHKISSKTGNPEVAGACFTLTPNPSTGTGTLVVCDKDASHTGANTTPDTDNRTGFVCLTGVKLTSYSITESTVPTGYKLGSITPNDGSDTSTGTITVSDSKSCADRETAGGSLVVTAVNIPLSEISVLFKSLAGPGVTTATIDCKEDGAAINLPFIFAPVSDLINGAAADLKKLYGDNTTNPGLLPGTYVCTVVIDP